MTQAPRKELLPCPFCGGEAKSFSNSRSSSSIMCVECGLTMTRASYDPYMGIVQLYDCQKAVINSWNRRSK
jgi:ribosomal protein L37AE/L43A